MIQALANHLWQSTLFTVATGLTCWLLRNDGAHVRYWLWWAASVKFLIPFAALTALGKVIAGTAGIALLPDSVMTTVVVVASPFAADGAMFTAGFALIALWFGGSLLLLIRWLVSAGRLRATLRGAERGEPVKAGDGRMVLVYRTTERIEPGIVGLFRPVLLMPRNIEQRLTPNQIEAIVSHELGHIRRHDNLLAAVHMLVQLVFWFHPFVWWIGAKLIDERERACDEFVVAAGHDRETYARGILDVCENFVASPLRCAAGISGSDLKRRITQIMRYQGMTSLNRIKKTLLSVAAVGVILVPLIGGFTVQQTAVAQDVAAPSGQADGEYLPIVKIAPVYPARAVADGLEGYVVVEYTITANGNTENVVAVESSSEVFEQSAIDSAMKYKYQPRIINGAQVAVEGVRTKIVFALESDDGADAAN